MNREQRRKTKSRPAPIKTVQVREDYIEKQCDRAASFATEATINAIAYSLVKNEHVTAKDLERIIDDSVTTLTKLHDPGVDFTMKEVKHHLQKHYSFNFTVDR